MLLNYLYSEISFPIKFNKDNILFNGFPVSPWPDATSNNIAGEYIILANPDIINDINNQSETNAWDIQEGLGRHLPSGIRGSGYTHRHNASLILKAKKIMNVNKSDSFFFVKYSELIK